MFYLQKIKILNFIKSFAKRNAERCALYIEKRNSGMYYKQSDGSDVETRRLHKENLIVFSNDNARPHVEYHVVKCIAKKSLVQIRPQKRLLTPTSIDH